MPSIELFNENSEYKNKIFGDKRCIFIEAVQAILTQFMNTRHIYRIR